MPDLIAEHHRPEDLDIEGIVSLPPASGSDSEFFGEDGLTFSDVLDIINPLQHIPIISTIYREITGDEIAALPRMIGGGLFGGLAGLGAATVNMIFDEASGKDLGEHIYTAFLGDDGNDGTMIAEAANPDAPWYMAGKVTYSRTVADGVELAQASPSSPAASPADVAVAAVNAKETASGTPAAPAADLPGDLPGDKPREEFTQAAAFAPDLSGPRVPINSLPWLDGTQTAQAAPIDRVTVTALADAAKIPAPTQTTPAAQNLRPARHDKTPHNGATLTATTTNVTSSTGGPAPTTLDFTNAMMDGLNKYRAMAVAKNDRMPVILDIVR
ncbi:MAG: hypothetical protein HOO00_05660 [Rhodospirillaceae bacterium]|nr:hypothetical protein [Rhodospirillaceae bacterium]